MKTIAVSGKGGTGKTTVAALIVRWLKEQGIRSILAVDADSNVNLNDLLGVEVTETIGTIREEMMKSIHNLPGGMTKLEFLEYKINSGLVEGPGFDLIAMGRPEGPGCYCYANNLLRDILNTMSRHYTYIVIDNEAGMEHLSRRTTQNIDFMMIVSDPSKRSINAAGKIIDLIKSLDIQVGETSFILNRSQDGKPETLDKLLEAEGIRKIATLPEDEILGAMDRAGDTIWSIGIDSIAYEALSLALTQLMNRGHHDI
ncbi:AAA family ATPase [Acidobacteriota bacterium]